MKLNRHLAALVTNSALVALVAGCGDASVGATPDADASSDTDTNDTAATPSWSPSLRGLSGALLSIWGTSHDDIWLVGADKNDGTGPMVVHGTTGFARLDLRPVDPAGGHLWWVFGPDADSVWMVGEGGRAFRHDRTTGLTTKVETGTDATLYGVWGASDDELWAVGGYVFPRTGEPTLVRLTPTGGEVVADLPSEVLGNGTFFKVWGTAKDDVWVIGEMGRIVHYDGATWSRVDLGATPRLVTIHGSSADDIVIVGGASQAVILEHTAAGFTDKSPGPYALLSGVWVAPDGSAWAAGMLGQVMRRSAPGAAWEAVSGVPIMKDWHAVWRDPRGDWWFVGGNLLSAARFDEGTVIRFGPPRTDVPTGALVDIEPGRPDDGPEPVEVEPVEDVEVVEVESAEVVETVEADVVEAPPEVIEDTADIASEVTDTIEPSPLEIGSLDHSSGVLTPFVAGQDVNLVHGPQGGFHVEAVVRFPWDSDAETLEAPVEMAVWVDGAVRGRFKSIAYPIPRLSEGVYQTYTLYASFCEDPPPGDCFIPLWDSAPFDGKAATLEVSVSPPGGTLRRELIVRLRDVL